MYYNCSVNKLKDKIFECKLCPQPRKQFSNNYSLHRHMYFLHTNESGKHPCKYDGKGFNSKVYLKSHMENKCGNDKKGPYSFSCDVSFR